MVTILQCKRSLNGPKIIYCFNLGLKLALTFLCEIHPTDVISLLYFFSGFCDVNVPVFIKALYYTISPYSLKHSLKLHPVSAPSKSL